jgi:hypothetical protein
VDILCEAWKSCGKTWKMLINCRPIPERSRICIQNGAEESGGWGELRAVGIWSSKERQSLLFFSLDIGPPNRPLVFEKLRGRIAGSAISSDSAIRTNALSTAAQDSARSAGALRKKPRGTLRPPWSYGCEERYFFLAPPFFFEPPFFFAAMFLFSLSIVHGYAVEIKKKPQLMIV